MSWRDQWRQTGKALQEEQEQAALKTLGFERDSASFDEIRERYKALAHRWHPDRHSGTVKKAAAEVEFKRIGEAFAQLQSHAVATRHEYLLLDPFGGAPWYSHTRFPPWSFSRGPPYAPGWFVTTILLGGSAMLYSALLYDAANPQFGERRVKKLIDREAELKQRRLAERAEEVAQANEMSQAARAHIATSVAAIKDAKQAEKKAAQARTWWFSR